MDGSNVPLPSPPLPSPSPTHLRVAWLHEGGALQHVQGLRGLARGVQDHAQVAVQHLHGKDGGPSLL